MVIHSKKWLYIILKFNMKTFELEIDVNFENALVL